MAPAVASALGLDAPGRVSTPPVYLHFLRATGELELPAGDTPASAAQKDKRPPGAPAGGVLVHQKEANQTPHDLLWGSLFEAVMGETLNYRKKFSGDCQRAGRRK